MATTSVSSRHAARPAFPEAWRFVDISQDELSLPNTLPVGQSFVWHRRPLSIQDAAEAGPSAIHPSSSLSAAGSYAEAESPSIKRERDASEPTSTLALPEMPTEEWSRAIPNPDRVILLRQTSSRIYYTSVCPPTACQPSATTLNSADLLFIQSYFALSLPTPTGGGGETASPSLMQLYRAWAELDPALFGRAYAEGRVPRGVRVLRQDVWECLVSFITSSANNVPRITSLMHRLSTHFSPPLLSLHDPAPPSSSRSSLDTVSSSTTYHIFPPASRLLSVITSDTPRDRFVVVRPDLETTLKQLGFGYRAGFITHTVARLLDRQGNSLMVDLDDGESDVDAVDRIGASIEMFLTGLRGREAATEAQEVEVEVEGEVDVSGKGGAKKGRQSVQRPPTRVEERWRTELQSFKGVGRKVADCIGLMSLDRPNAVPIDTHIQQIAARHPSFPARLRQKPTSTESVYREVQDFLTAVWGGGGRRVETATVVGTGGGMAGWVQAVMFAADLKGSTAVKLEDMVKLELERTVVEVVQTDVAATSGRGKRTKEEVVLERTTIEEDIKPSLLDLVVTPMTPTPALSTRSDASPADSALLTPMELTYGLGGYGYEGEPPTTPTKGTARPAQSGKRRHAAGDMVDITSTGCLSPEGIVEWPKRRRTRGQ